MKVEITEFLESNSIQTGNLGERPLKMCTTPLCPQLVMSMLASAVPGLGLWQHLWLDLDCSAQCNYEKNLSCHLALSVFLGYCAGF